MPIKTIPYRQFNKQTKSLFIIIILMGVFFNLSCRNCKKQYYAPDFTEEQLTWVKFENMNPQYRVTTIKDGDTIVDTVTIERSYTIDEGLGDHERCEMNSHYKTVTGSQRFGNSTYKSSIESSINGYTLNCSLLDNNNLPIGIEGLPNDPRTDTATINGHFYNDVFKKVTMSFSTRITFYLSRESGIIFTHFKLNNGDVNQMEIL